jgi:hypothetical protein
METTERQATFDNKWVYADLHKTFGPRENDLALVCRGTYKDLERHGILLQEGLSLTFWMDDGDLKGKPDPLVFRATVTFDHDANYWLADVDYLTMRHASRLSEAEIDWWVIEKCLMDFESWQSHRPASV